MTNKRPDRFFQAILGLVLVVVAWLLATPLIPAVARTTMKRFHLQTEHFVVWAVQFPVPSMYNFSNRVRIRNTPPIQDSLLGMDDEFALIIGTASEWRMINHFPTRSFTFADGRYFHLRDGQPRWFDLESSYRGQTLSSEFYLEPVSSGDFQAGSSEASNYKVIRESMVFEHAPSPDSPRLNEGPSIP